MFATIKRLYIRTGNEIIVRNAVKKGWITQVQYGWQGIPITAILVVYG